MIKKKNSFIKFNFFFFVLGTIYLISSCKSFIEKSSLRQVNRIAIISISSGKNIYHTKRPGKFAIEVFNKKTLRNSNKKKSLKKLIEVSAYSKKVRPYKRLLNLILYSEKEFIRIFSGNINWEIISSTQLTDSTILRKFRKFQEEKFKYKFSDLTLPLHNNKLFLKSLTLPVNNINDEIPQLKKLARDLKVDAIAFIGLDFGYEPEITVKGAGIAKIGTDVSVLLMNQRGEFILNTGKANIKEAGYFAKKQVSVLADIITINGEVESLLKQTITTGLETIFSRVEKELETPKL